MPGAGRIVLGQCAHGIDVVGRGAIDQGSLEAGGFDTGFHHIHIFRHQDHVEFRGFGDLLGHGGEGGGITVDIFYGHQLGTQVEARPARTAAHSTL
jgi:hypothetical protein